MASVTNYVLKCNNKIELNFDGGDLSSDSGLFLIKEFLEKIHFHNIAEHILMIDDQVKARIHSNADILMQMLFQIFAAYFADDRADFLRMNPL